MSDRAVTLAQFVLQQERIHPEASGQFTSLLLDVALAAKMINKAVIRAGLADVLGATGTVNVQGEKKGTGHVEEDLRVAGKCLAGRGAGLFRHRVLDRLRHQFFDAVFSRSLWLGRDLADALSPGLVARLVLRVFAFHRHD